MDRLPPEILTMIVKEVNDPPYLLPGTNTRWQDLKNLRLTCRCLPDIVAPHLFQKVQVGLFKTSLKRFDELSRHPSIPKHVKMLCFVGCVMPVYKSQREWEDAIELRVPRIVWSERIGYFRVEYQDVPPDQCTEESLKFRWAKYSEYLQDQQEWGEAEDQAFAEAFARLPHVWHISETKLNGAWDEVKTPLPSVRRETLFYLNKPLDPMSPQRETIQTRHTRCLLNAIDYRSRHKEASSDDIDQLYLFNSGGQAFSAAASPEQGLQRVPTLKYRLPSFECFKHLGCLMLSFEHFLPTLDELEAMPHTDVRADAHAVVRGEPLLAEVREMLSRAKNLNHLGLHMTPLDRDDGWKITHSHDLLGQMIENLECPQLETLALSVTATPESILGFLRLHSRTLRELELYDCDLVGEAPCWESVLGRLPHILQLETISVEDLSEEGSSKIFTGKWSWLLHDWVLNGGKLDPPITRPELIEKYGYDDDILVFGNLIDGVLSMPVEDSDYDTDDEVLSETDFDEDSDVGW